MTARSSVSTRRLPLEVPVVLRIVNLLPVIDDLFDAVPFAVGRLWVIHGVFGEEGSDVVSVVGTPRQYVAVHPVVESLAHRPAKLVRRVTDSATPLRVTSPDVRLGIDTQVSGGQTSEN